MRRVPPQELADLAHCSELLRAGSKSFALAGTLMPTRIMRDVTALYAFCRVADDLIDESGHPHRAHAQLMDRLDALHTAATAESGLAVEQLTYAVDRALARTMRRQKLPRAPIDALLEGFLWDADGHTYATIEDTFAYAARVAGSVGVCMAWLMGRREPWVLARAADLGVAMQLTNIARDVGDDARIGRVYLPGTWLAEEHATPAELVHLANMPPQPCPSVAATTARLLACADRLYARGRTGLAALPSLGGRAAIDAASRIYRDIGAQIAHARPHTLHRRAVVPLWRKLYLMACALVNPWGRRGRAVDRYAAPLCANLFLLEGLNTARQKQAGHAYRTRPRLQRGA